MKRTEDGLLNTVSTLQDEMTTKGDQLVMLTKEKEDLLSTTALLREELT
jgi:hypothetical protein